MSENLTQENQINTVAATRQQRTGSITPIDQLVERVGEVLPEPDIETTTERPKPIPYEGKLNIKHVIDAIRNHGPRRLPVSKHDSTSL